MNYTLHQFQIFKKVAELGSISRAAEELFMTQPAVSLQLKKFQEQFDIPIYELKGRKIIITEFGKEILDNIDDILSLVNNLKYKSKDIKEVKSGKLKISSASTGMYVIPYYISEFLKKYPEIDIMLDFTNRTNAIKSLKNKDTELAVVSILPDTFSVDEEPLIENALVMVVKPGVDYKNLPYIFREKGSATRKMMEQYFITHHLHLEEKRKIELTSNEAVKQAVLAGVGISILPIMSIKRELDNGLLQIIRKKGLPIYTHWRLIWLKNRKLTPVAEAFIQFVRKHKYIINKKYFG